jgi:hypothetical protein
MPKRNDYETGWNRDERYLINKIRIAHIENNEKEILDIIAPKITRGMAISAGKLRAKIKRFSGITEELLGPKE